MSMPMTGAANGKRESGNMSDSLVMKEFRRQLDELMVNALDPRKDPTLTPEGLMKLLMMLRHDPVDEAMVLLRKICDLCSSRGKIEGARYCAEAIEETVEEVVQRVTLQMSKPGHA
jgi:hypothetical protein